MNISDIHRRQYMKEWREVYEKCVFEFSVKNENK